MTPKRWRYRRVTPELVDQMKELREQGLSYAKIGKKFDLNPRTVKYWVDDKYREKCIERAKARKKKPLTPEQKERQRAYIRKYIKERYNTDPEFRERFLKHTKKWQDKNREKLNEYQREWQKRKREEKDND